jgi:predicted metalloprotease
VNALSRAPAFLAALLSMGAGAAPAAPPVNDAAQHDATVQRVQALLSDANGTWLQQFKSLGALYAATDSTFFNQTVRKACGSDLALSGSFYCPDERKIYFDLALLQKLSDDGAMAYLVGHELGHHIQSLLGTTALVAQARSRSSPAVSARTWMVAELQADCYAGIWLGSAIKRGVIHPGGAMSVVLEAVAAASQSANAHLPAGAQAPDPVLTYGTAPQRLAWLQRGIDGGSINQCDTFGAEASGKL